MAAQPLLPDHRDLGARSVAHLWGPSNAALHVAVSDRGVEIASKAGSVQVPTPVWNGFVIQVLRTLKKARDLVHQFFQALRRAIYSDSRAIKGAAIQVQRALRSGAPLTPGLVRQVWAAGDHDFGEAVCGVASWLGCNPGKVRIVLTEYVAYWRLRTPNSAHWLTTLAGRLAMPSGVVAAVVTANKRWHRKRGREKQLTGPKHAA